MREDELAWVRDTFASGKVTILRLLTDHSVHDCGNAVGISGEAWWGLENGQLITDHRAETLYPVLASICRTASALTRLRPLRKSPLRPSPRTRPRRRSVTRSPSWSPRSA